MIRGCKIPHVIFFALLNESFNTNSSLIIGLASNREVPVPAKEEKKHSEPGLQVRWNIHISCKNEICEKSGKLGSGAWVWDRALWPEDRGGKPRWPFLILPFLLLFTLLIWDGGEKRGLPVLREETAEEGMLVEDTEKVELSFLFLFSFSTLRRWICNS